MDRPLFGIDYGEAVQCAVTENRADIVDALLSSQCVGVPTDTVFGLAARLSDPAALSSLFELKGRDVTKAVAVLVDSIETARTLGVFDRVAETIATTYWPGEVTLVVSRRSGIDCDLGGDAATIGLRCPDSPFIASLVAEVGALATTSANRAGEPTLRSSAEIADAFAGAIPFVFDAGMMLSGTASTVIDVRGPTPRLLREGSVAFADIEALLK